MVGRQRGLCLPPLRGRWCKDYYLFGRGGGRLRGGRAATEIVGIMIGIVVESLD